MTNAVHGVVTVFREKSFLGRGFGSNLHGSGNVGLGT
jgi:hypothetical protein